MSAAKPSDSATSSSGRADRTAARRLTLAAFAAVVEDRRAATYMFAMRFDPIFERFRLHGSSLMSRSLPSRQLAVEPPARGSR